MARWLSGASELEPLSRSRGCSCLLPARPAAPLSTALQAGQGRAGQAAGALAWCSALTGSCSLFLCSRREQQQEEEGAALALCSAADPGRCPGARAGGLWLQPGALWPAPGSHLRGGRRAAPAHPGKPACLGGPQPSLRLLGRGSVPRSSEDGGLGSSGLAPALVPAPLRGEGAGSGAELWPRPPLSAGSSSAKQLSCCVSCRSSWLSCTKKDRRRRGYSGEVPAGQRFGS